MFGLNEMAARLAYSGIVLVVVFLIYLLFGLLVNMTVRKRAIAKARVLMVRRITRTLFLIVGLFAVLSAWGSADSVWVSITGFLGIVAIGFFAVWSLLSNVVACFLIILSDPFRLNDEIVVLPDNIAGRVVDLKLLFVVLENEEGGTIHIPNNLLFQRVILKK